VGGVGRTDGKGVGAEGDTVVDKREGSMVGACDGPINTALFPEKT